jgi:hypothetical protein
MYNSSAINKAEIQEWLNNTIQALLDGQAPGRVLKISTGTSIVLFNLAKSIGLESYVGLKPLRKATTFVTYTIKSSPALIGKANVHISTAIDIGRLDNLQPDLVVLNSVV